MMLRFWMMCLLLVGCTPGQDPVDPSHPFGPPDIGEPFPFDPDAGVPSGPPPSFGHDVVTAQTPPPPLSGGTLAILHDGNTAVASDPDRDQIYIVDLTTAKLVTTLPLTAGDEPGRVIEDAMGRVHVALRRGGGIVTFDPAHPENITRRSVCPAPRGLAYAKTDDALHVACAGGELVTMPAAGGDITRKLQLERDLRDAAMVNGELWITTFKKAQILALGVDGTVKSRTDLPGGFDLEKNALTPTVAWRMLPIADDRVMITHQYASSGMVVPAPGGYGGGGDPCGGISRGAVALMTSDHSHTSAMVAEAVLPADVAYAPKQQALAVLAAGNSHTLGLSQVVVLSALTMPADSSVGGPESGACDFGLGMGVDGEAIALAYDGQEQLWVQTREPATLQRVDGMSQPVAVTLSNDSRADTGWAIFHSNSGAGLACASCHPEGGEDGHVWEFNGLGPRRTQSVRGRVTDTAPFHWSGDIPSTDALVSEVWSKRMAGPTLEAGQSKALFNWVDAIPLLPQSTPADTTAVARGQALFQSKEVGCASCHFGPQMTNNGNADVGTGGTFQVPRLLGVAWRAPFLHNGCASTLADRFGTCGGGNAHGVTSKLAATDISDLVAYLETL